MGQKEELFRKGGGMESIGIGLKDVKESRRNLKNVEVGR